MKEKFIFTYETLQTLQNAGIKVDRRFAAAYKNFKRPAFYGTIAQANN